jgi:parallel beta-helix repeat protein
MFLESCNKNTISYNYIDFNSYGIAAEPYFSFTLNKIIGNSIRSNLGDGLDLSGMLNIVRYNIIENNSQGIIIQGGIFNIVSKNVIANNTKFGLFIAYSAVNLINSNNIVKNRINAAFFSMVGTVFFQNYWKPNLGLRPKFIPGIQFGIFGTYEMIVPIIFPWLKVDWFAARLPHNIPAER